MSISSSFVATNDLKSDVNEVVINKLLCCFVERLQQNASIPQSAIEDALKYIKNQNAMNIVLDRMISPIISELNKYVRSNKNMNEDNLQSMVKCFKQNKIDILWFNNNKRAKFVELLQECNVSKGTAIKIWNHFNDNQQQIDKEEQSMVYVSKYNIIPKKKNKSMKHNNYNNVSQAIDKEQHFIPSNLPPNGIKYNIKPKKTSSKHKNCKNESQQKRIDIEAQRQCYNTSSMEGKQVNEYQYKSKHVIFDGKAAGTTASDKFDEIGKEALRLTNKYRKEKFLSICTWDQSLCDIAKKHSQYLSDISSPINKSTAHHQLDDRTKQCGFVGFRVLRENVHRIKKERYNDNTDDVGRFAVDDWINSTGHEQNLLSNDVSYCGIGVCVDRDGNYYLTQLLGGKE